MANKTGTQIKALAESYTEGDTITDANALLWINEFLVNNLREGAGIKDTQNYTSSIARTRYDMPTGAILVHKMEKYSTSAMTDTEYHEEYFNYEIEDDEIWFEENGNFKLTFFVLPTELTAIGSTMTVNQMFDKACALWLAYRYLTNDDEDNAKSQSLGQLRLAEYSGELRMAISNRMNMFKKKRRIRRGRI